jgi:hypothetical protein
VTHREAKLLLLNGACALAQVISQVDAIENQALEEVEAYAASTPMSALGEKQTPTPKFVSFDRCTTPAQIL